MNVLDRYEKYVVMFFNKYRIWLPLWMQSTKLICRSDPLLMSLSMIEYSGSTVFVIRSC